jgi:hypothetical protein
LKKVVEELRAQLAEDQKARDELQLTHEEALENIRPSETMNKAKNSDKATLRSNLHVSEKAQA